MATITRTPHELPGTLGPILVDVRTSSPRAALPVVLIHHGFKGFKDWGFFPVLAERLARAGLHAVTVSVSGCGVDAAGDFTHLDRFAANTHSRELADLHTVLDALTSGALGLPVPPSLGLVGHSRGGGLSLCLAREHPAITALVTWAAIARVRRYDEATMTAWQARGTLDVPHARLGRALPLDYAVAADWLEHETGRYDLLAAAAGLRMPWLLVHGTADETVPLSEGEALYAAADHRTTTPLWVAEAGHTFGAAHPWQGATPATEQLLSATSRFLLARLG